MGLRLVIWGGGCADWKGARRWPGGLDVGRGVDDVVACRTADELRLCWGAAGVCNGFAFKVARDAVATGKESWVGPADGSCRSTPLLFNGRELVVCCSLFTTYRNMRVQIR